MSWACRLTSTGLLNFPLLWAAHVAPPGAWHRGSVAYARLALCPLHPTLGHQR